MATTSTSVTWLPPGWPAEGWSPLGWHPAINSGVPIPDVRPRYQSGDRVRVNFPMASKTDDPPMASVYGPGGNLIGRWPIPMIWLGSQRAYQALFLAEPGAELGTYRVSIAYSVGGVAGAAHYFFDLVPGGDSGGSIISLYQYDRPEGRFCLGQLSSGRVVQGRNPHL